MTAVDDRPGRTAGGGDPERDWRAAFLAGYTLGHRHGAEDAEADMAEAWAVLARGVRRDADRLTRPVRAPANRPQSDDSIWFRPDEWAALTKEAQ